MLKCQKKSQNSFLFWCHIPVYSAYWKIKEIGKGQQRIKGVNLGAWGPAGVGVRGGEGVAS